MNANRSDLLVSLLLGSILPQMRASAAADGFADLDTLLSGVRKRNIKHQLPAEEPPASNAAAKEAAAAEAEADRQAEAAARQGSAKGGNADGYQYSIPVRKTVPDILREAAETYEGRNPVYGDAYKHYGAVMMGFFPQGLYINEPEDWNRFGLFSMMVSKMNRIAANLTTGGHRDSSLDLSVYAGMMTELTEEK